MAYRDFPGLPVSITGDSDLSQIGSQIAACVAWVADELANDKLDLDGVLAYTKLIAESRKMLDAERAARQRQTRMELAQSRFKHQTRELDELLELDAKSEEKVRASQERATKARLRMKGN